jgi:hypothetical protein
MNSIKNLVSKLMNLQACAGKGGFNGYPGLHFTIIQYLEFPDNDHNNLVFVPYCTMKGHFCEVSCTENSIIFKCATL